MLVTQSPQMAAHSGALRYWIGGLLILATALVFLSGVVFSTNPGVCNHPTETVLAVAFALGTGIGFIGSEALTKVTGNAEIPGLGKRIAFSLGGGIAAFAIGLACTNWVLNNWWERSCHVPSPPIPSACLEYGSDGKTCMRCIVPALFRGLGKGASTPPARCSRMAPNARVRVEFAAVARVDQKAVAGRQAKWTLVSRGTTIASLPREAADDELLTVHLLSGSTKTDENGVAEANASVTTCFYDRKTEGKDGTWEGTCSADFAFMDIRAE